jgi:hypothetical protein
VPGEGGAGTSMSGPTGGVSGNGFGLVPGWAGAGVSGGRCGGGVSGGGCCMALNLLGKGTRGPEGGLPNAARLL